MRYLYAAFYSYEAFKISWSSGYQKGLVFMLHQKNNDEYWERPICWEESGFLGGGALLQFGCRWGLDTSEGSWFG